MEETRSAEEPLLAPFQANRDNAPKGMPNSLKISSDQAQVCLPGQDPSQAGAPSGRR
jgi:hypothetical protein